MVQGKGVAGEQGRGPGGGLVAADAVLPKHAGVEFWLFVAGGAVTRCAAKHLPHVAAFARGVGMDSFERENVVMVKAGQLGVPIVAVQAGLAELVGMGGHHGRVGVAVAVGAVDGIGGKAPVDVATVAGEFDVVGVVAVGFQAKAGELLVVDVGQGEDGDVGLAALVFFVAGLAFAGAG